MDKKKFEVGDPKYDAQNGRRIRNVLRELAIAKAEKCIRIAQTMMPKGASVNETENRASDFMDLPDSEIHNLLVRLGLNAGEEVVPENFKKASGPPRKCPDCKDGTQTLAITSGPCTTCHGTMLVPEENA